MLGYYNKPAETAQKIRDGWLHTGDMAIKDADGYVRITGRLSDMIIVGGFNTYPAEIEDFFLRHPKILDISIVGVPDPIMGETVMAFVIPREGETLSAEEVLAFARGKIANFKVPKYVEIVDRFPLTGSGKVQKFRQKEYAIAKYRLAGDAMPPPGPVAR
jgi:fatty-acyl-CoA synthase